MAPPFCLKRPPMTKKERYAALLPQAPALLGDEEDVVARMANLAALLHREMGFWWTGFYRVDGEQLVLGPFQGPVACSRIGLGLGVCGTAWSEKRTIVVPDVDRFRGHIACSSESRSEIVVPLWSHGTIEGVLDIDSREPGAFDAVDRRWLERIAALVYGPQRDIWFAAGCFWGAQKFFKMVPGVEFTEVGYVNGWVQNPSYEQVYTDTTGHAECVHVRYNPQKVSLRRLAGLFFKIIDPLSLNRQGEDEGTRYRTGIYYEDERDYEILRREFERQRKALGVEEFPVELLAVTSFYRAEEYHQDYLDKNPGGYCHLSPQKFKLIRP